MASYSVIRSNAVQNRYRRAELASAVPEGGVEYLASGGTSAAMVGENQVWIVTAVGGDGWCRFDGAAAVGSTHPLTEGIPREFNGIAGQTCSVIDNV